MTETQINPVAPRRPEQDSAVRVGRIVDLAEEAMLDRAPEESPEQPAPRPNGSSYEGTLTTKRVVEAIRTHGIRRRHVAPKR